MASFLTLNINGLRDPNKRLSFLQWLSRLSVDFVCLQETHILSCVECEAWFSSYGFMTFASPGSVHSCGTVILYRPKFELTNSVSDPDGRFVLAHFKHREICFGVASIYAPNRNPERNDFLHYCIDQIDPSIPTVICGDFNTVMDRSLDRRGSFPLDSTRESSVALRALLDECCATDIWRFLHPDTRAYTWMRADGSLSSRIDLIGCPLAWSHSVQSCEIVPCPFSDHSAVLMESPLPLPFPRGPGRWKLNIAVLKDPAFLDSVKEFWAYWRTRKLFFLSLLEWWDVGKEKVKGLAIRFCSAKQSERRQCRSLLSTLAAHLKFKIDNGLVSLLEVYERVLGKIADLDRSAAEGARVRSRVRWAEEGETSSHFFLRLERKAGSDNWIPAMRRTDGSIATGIDSICTSWVDFYSALFTAGEIDFSAQDDLLSNLSARLPSDARAQCEGLLSSHEVFEALKGMAHNKSPGSDGLPMEFYLAFWGTLGSDLVEVLNSSFVTGSLPSSQKGALISLIFKKGDRLEHKNWRPISLLNVDYKLCARALAGRLLGVLHHIIAPDQTCGVRGRFIGENVALLRDIVQFTSETNTPAAVLSLDQEKAFDRVDWPFLFRVLEHCGFGPSFVSWVKLLYSGIRSAVLINGYTSQAFFPSRGVRQGCPLSPLLYVISIEVLAANLRAHPAIVGLRLPGLPNPLPAVSLYADDTSVISVSDVATLAVFDVYDTFEQGTGSKLNLGKCEGLWLGSWRDRPDSPVGILWSSVKIKVLGVYVGNGNLDESNWRPRLTAVERCLNSWRARSLSYSGKAVIINALALSRIWYVASLVSMPVWVYRELSTLIFDFFWSGKRDLVARDVLCHPLVSGGFSVVSIKFKVQALLVQWVKRSLACPNGWVYLLTYWFRDRFDATPFEVFSNPCLFTSSVLPPFYSSLLQAWVALGGSSLSSDLVFGSGAPGGPFLASSMSCKLCYSLLLELNPAQPHCVAKFAPSFGPLDWSSTWRSLQFMPLDRQVRDLNWKIAHGVLYTAERLISFGYQYQPSCFCGHPLESLEHLFFSCPLFKSGLDWIQSLLFLASPLAPTINVRHALFGFSSDDLRCVPRVFAYLLNVCKYLVWLQRNDFRFRSVRPSAVRLLAALKQRVHFYLPLFFKRFVSSRRRRYFSRQWGAGGVVGRLDGTSFKVLV